MFKLIRISIIFIILFTPIFVLAANPVGNPLCWIEDACKKTGGEFCNDDKKCLGQEGQCSGEWGFCYPKPGSITTELQVPIGGLTKISSASDYVRTIYQVSLGIAVTAAIVVIMLAGFRWMTSGGNSSAIGQAKTMILSAIIGLLLLLGASLLFQTINPDIVRLTLPRAPKLRPQSLTQTTWCDELFQRPDETKRFAYANKAPNLKKPEEAKAADFKEKTKLGFLQEECGNGWYPQDSPNTPCYSRKCSNDEEICLLDETTGGYGCKEATLGGTISAAQSPVSVTLWQVCNDGEVAPSIISNIDYPDAVADLYTGQNGNFAYYFNIRDELDPSALCLIHKGEKGYILAVELEEPGINTTYALKKSGDSCTIFSTENDVYDIDDKLAGASADIFFQRDSLKAGAGLRCDINMSK